MSQSKSAAQSLYPNLPSSSRPEQQHTPNTASAMSLSQPTAAQALYGHLSSGERREVEQRRRPNIADAIWPAWSREAKQRGRDQRLWDEICKRNRDITLRNLRERREGR